MMKTSMKEIPILKLNGKRYYILPEELFKEILELLEDLHDDKVCDAREKEESIPLEVFKALLKRKSVQNTRKKVR